MTNENLKSLDWSTSRASKVQNGAIGSGHTVETHVRNDGTYLIEKDRYGTPVSVKKVA